MQDEEVEVVPTVLQMDLEMVQGQVAVAEQKTAPEQEQTMVLGQGMVLERTVAVVVALVQALALT